MKLVLEDVLLESLSEAIIPIDSRRGFLFVCF